MSAIPDIAVGVPAGRKGYKTALYVLAVIFAAGALSFIYMLATAPAAVPWAFLTASFVFLLGISQFGIAFVAIMRICRAKWARPFYRTGEIATLAFMPFTLVLLPVIFIFGRQQLFFWLSPEPGQHLSPWLNADFLLWRNLAAQVLFYTLSVVYFLMGLIPDAPGAAGGHSDGLRGAFHRWLASQNERRDNRHLKSRLYTLAPLILVLAVIANTFISWDFGMMLFPHYHSTVYPMYFILGIMLAGTAAVVILAAVTSATLGLSGFFDSWRLKSAGILITAFALLWIYMFWAQFFVTWFGNLTWETGPLASRMYGHYAPYFWVMMTFIFAVPIGSMIFAYVKRHWWSLLTVCVIIVVGVWLNRYLLVVPALMPDHTPFSSPSELLLVAGLYAGFLLLFLVLLKTVPMVSAWEMRDAAGEEGPAY